jgi:hypothetical protein
MQRRPAEISTYRGVEKDPAAGETLRRDVATGPVSVWTTDPLI